MQIIVATNNKGKLCEIKSIFKNLPISVIGQEEAGINIKVEETGKTFLENAVIKARAVGKFSPVPVLADDSGLCVDALGGAPGVFSARYAGEGASSDMLIAKLLTDMKDIPKGKRGAYFITSAVLYMPDGSYYSAEGRIEGVITSSPAGNCGFGYDPVFMPDGYDKTFAQMDDECKNRLSHRYRAMCEIKRIMENTFIH